MSMKKEGESVKSDEGKSKQSSPSTMRPALTEKARKIFQDKLDKIPSEKRETVLPKMLKVAQSQYETAQKKGSNKTLIRKLEAIVEMIQDEIDSADDASLFDSLTAE